MSPARWFTQHPASVGETYLGHARVASRFAVRMLLGGAACLLHAIFPFLCVRTGSDCVAELYERMIVDRRHARGADPDVHENSVSRVRADDSEPKALMRVNSRG